jgi:hypothetical protein
MYKSLFKIFIHEGTLISEAFTIQALLVFKDNHSTPSSVLSIINSFKFNIISKTLSFIQGKVEYS